MPVENWARIKEIFSNAVPLSGSDRAAYIESACANDPSSRALIEELLANHRGADGPSGATQDGSDWVITPPTPRNAFQDEELLGGRFRIIRFVGRGGMGEVYEAADLELGGRVALKTLRPELLMHPRGATRFKREVQLARQVAHPNVCRVFDVGWHKSTNGSEVAYLTMEFVDGETLGAHLKREGRLSPDVALPLIRQMAHALAALHAVNIIHRDFKPGNVMLSTSLSGERRAVVTDFGLARSTEAGERADTIGSSILAGTPAYMPPEQLLGGLVGPYSDVYALGTVCYEVLTGTHPFRREDETDGGLRKLTEAPQRPSALVAELEGPWDDFVLACLERDVSRRAADTRETLRLLDRVEGGREGVARDTADGSGARSTSRAIGNGRGGRTLQRGQFRRWGLVAALALVTAAASVMVWPGPRRLLAAKLCRQFPGSALFCALPADKDVAIVAWSTGGVGGSDARMAEGLETFLNEAFYRLYPEKDSMCVHIRRDQRSEGVNLRMEGAIRVDADAVEITVAIKDARNPDGMTLRRIHRTYSRSNDQALYVEPLMALADAFELQYPDEDLAAWLAPRPVVPGVFSDYLIAQGRAKAGEFVAAARQLSLAVSRDPTFALGYVALGDVSKTLAASDRSPTTREAEQDWNLRAHRAYEAAIEFDDLEAFPWAWAGLGELELSDDPSSGIAHLEHARTINLYDHSIQTRLSDAYKAQDNTRAAEQVWRQAVQLNRHCWLARNSAANHYGQNGQADLSLRELEEFVKLEPDHSIANNNLAYQYMEVGRPVDAIQAAGRAVAAAPEQAMTYSALGRAYSFRGCHADALTNLRRAVELADQSRNPNANADQLYREVVVRRMLAEAVEVIPGDGAGVRSSFSHVLAAADRLLAISPGDMRGRRERAAALCRLEGRRAEALQEIKRVLERAPTHMLSWLTATMVHELAGNRESALKALEEGFQRRGVSIYDVENSGALASLREDRRYLRIAAGIRSDPRYRGGDLAYAGPECPAWDKPGRGLREDESSSPD